jgi:hypothetical protein
VKTADRCTIHMKSGNLIVQGQFKNTCIPRGGTTCAWQSFRRFGSVSKNTVKQNVVSQLAAEERRFYISFKGRGNRSKVTCPVLFYWQIPWKPTGCVTSVTLWLLQTVYAYTACTQSPWGHWNKWCYYQTRIKIWQIVQILMEWRQTFLRGQWMLPVVHIMTKTIFLGLDFKFAIWCLRGSCNNWYLNACGRWIRGKGGAGCRSRVRMSGLILPFSIPMTFFLLFSHQPINT